MQQFFHEQYFYQGNLKYNKAVRKAINDYNHPHVHDYAPGKNGNLRYVPK